MLKQHVRSKSWNFSDFYIPFKFIVNQGLCVHVLYHTKLMICVCSLYFSGHVYVASQNFIWRLVPIPITAQIKELLHDKQFELALHLAVSLIIMCEFLVWKVVWFMRVKIKGSFCGTHTRLIFFSKSWEKEPVEAILCFKVIYTNSVY